MKSEPPPVAAAPPVVSPVATPPKEMSYNRPPAIGQNPRTTGLLAAIEDGVARLTGQNWPGWKIVLVVVGICAVVFAVLGEAARRSAATSHATVASTSAPAALALDPSYATGHREDPTPPDPAYTVSQLEVLGEMMLKQSLRDPDSYKRIGWTTYTNKLAGVDIPAPFTVHGLKYRAKNGFGGYDVGEQIYIFGPNGLVPYTDKK